VKPPDKDVLIAIEGLKATNFAQFEKIVEWFRESYESDLKNALSPIVSDKEQHQAAGSANTLSFILNVIESARNRIESTNYIEYVTSKKG